MRIDDELNLLRMILKWIKGLIRNSIDMIIENDDRIND